MSGGGSRIVRSLCYFVRDAFPPDRIISRVLDLKSQLESAGFVVQTVRICSPSFLEHGLVKSEQVMDPEGKLGLFLSCGSVKLQHIQQEFLEDFLQTRNMAFNLDLTGETIDQRCYDILHTISVRNPGHSFRFAFGFGSPNSSPYFPSAAYSTDGFSIGFQPTDLTENCDTLDMWLQKMQSMWMDIVSLFGNCEDFLGIDSSIAPLYDSHSSLIHFIQKLGMSFEESVLTDSYLKITKFIK